LIKILEPTAYDILDIVEEHGEPIDLQHLKVLLKGKGYDVEYNAIKDTCEKLSERGLVRCDWLSQKGGAPLIRYTGT